MPERKSAPALTVGQPSRNAPHNEQQRPVERIHRMWRRARSMTPHVVGAHSGRRPAWGN